MRLPSDMQNVIDRIASDGFPPLADSYLRFRLAESHVERFLALVDCVEVVIKTSAILLLASNWTQGGSTISYNELHGQRPATLGAWVSLLERLALKGTSEGEVQRLREFWLSDISSTQQEFIAAYALHDLPAVGERTIQSYIEWARWFTDVRNATRGHGVLDERMASTISHLLHESVLHIVSCLESNLLSASLAVPAQNGSAVILSGWFRKDRRYSTWSMGVLPPEEAMARLILSPEQQLMLHPLIVTEGNRVYIWDRVRSESLDDSGASLKIEFLEYASGERKRLPVGSLSSSDPYEIWRSAQQT